MDKLIKTFLHLWIFSVSVMAFAFGWVFLAHSQKPDPLVLPQVQIYTPNKINLEPIPTINEYLTNGASQAPVFPNPNVDYPRLRTGGS